MKAQYSFDSKTKLPGFGLYVLDKKAVFLNAKAVEMLGLGPQFTNAWVHPKMLLEQFSMPIVHKIISFVRHLKDAKCDLDQAKEIELNSFRLRKLNLDNPDLNYTEDLSCECQIAYSEDQIPNKPKIDHSIKVANALDPFFSSLTVADQEKDKDHDSQDVNCLNGLATKEQKLALKKYLERLSACDSASFAIVLDKGPLRGSKVYVKFHALFANGKLSHINITLTKLASALFVLTPHKVADSASFDWYIPTGECIFGRNYYDILGYEHNDETIPKLKTHWRDLVIHPEDVDIINRKYDLFNDRDLGDDFEFLYRSKRKDGSYIWTKSIGCITARNNLGKATRVIGINIDINSVMVGYEQLQNKVFTDILTGIKNRTYLIANLENFIFHADKPMTVLFADVTALKAYNDYLGHTVGDRLLCSATILLQQAINQENKLIRISGDEVVSILHNCNREQALAIENNIEAVVCEYNKSAPIRMPVFLSAGTVTIDLSQYAGRPLNDHEKEIAMSIFYQAIQDADTIMQKHKKKNYDVHYAMVREYIQSQLKQRIEIQDKRLFA